jgi:hypothetical protein
MEGFMLHTFKNWPKTTVVAACTVIACTALLLGIANAPGAHHRTAASTSPSQPLDAAYKPAFGNLPQRELPEEHYMDYSVVYPQHER